MLKTIALIGTLALAAGIIGTAVTVHREVGTVTGTYSLDETKTLSVDSIKNLAISMGTGTVKVRPVDGNQIRVHLYGNVTKAERNNLEFSTENDGGVANIEVRQKSFLLDLDWLSLLNNRDRGLHLDISVPKREYDEITIDSGTGTVDAANLTSAETKVDTGTGHMSISNVTGKLNLQTGTGAMDVTVKAITSDITAHAGTGSIDIQVADEPKNLQYHVDTGIGHISFNLLSMSNESNFHGNVDGQVGSGGPTLDVSTGTGAVTIERTAS